MDAFKEIVKSRNYEQREINEAYQRIEKYEEQIKYLKTVLEKKEQLVSEYDTIINHARELLPKESNEIVPQNEEEKR
ncbi:hypothetical protein [Metabacillus sp. Hm71]|uniref:hypothetical protein n=1 Tax=Metabacillus sp. Hm71 TaxID=3450743 RepID=UPI003F42FA7C